MTQKFFLTGPRMRRVAALFILGLTDRKTPGNRAELLTRRPAPESGARRGHGYLRHEWHLYGKAGGTKGETPLDKNATVYRPVLFDPNSHTLT